MIQNNTIININSLLNLTARLYESDNDFYILNATLLSLMGKLKILRAIVLIPDGENDFTPLIIKGNISIGSVPGFELNDFTLTASDDRFSYLRMSGIEYLIPVKNLNSFYAVICLGKSLSEIDLTDEEIDYINLISAIAANSINNARTVVSYKNAKNKVEQRNQLLSTLFEISKDFSQNFSGEKIIKMLALNLMGQLTVSRFAVISISEAGEIKQIVNRFGEMIDNEILLILSECDFAQDISKFHNYSKIESSALRLHLQVVAPMIVQGARRGLLIIGRKMNGTEFTDENLLFIEAVGNAAMAALENERLFREELEKKRLESELSIALEIQKNLLPDKSPVMQNFHITGTSLPSRHVAGDLFDYIRLDDQRYLIAIADVSGKGIPASLIMANFQAALRVLAMSGISLADIVIKINNLLYHNTAADKFVTSFFCIIDDSNGKVSYINAGHNPPFVKRNYGDIEKLTNGGLILGFMEHPFEYQEGEIYLNKGDLMILYTDGVTEAENKNGEDYGENRLEQFMHNVRTDDSEIIMNELIGSVKSYICESHQNDDITLVVINRYG